MLLIKFVRLLLFVSKNELISSFIELKKFLLSFSIIFFIFCFSFLKEVSKSIKEVLNSELKTFNFTGKFSLFDVSIFSRIFVNCCLKYFIISSKISSTYMFLTKLLAVFKALSLIGE